MKAPYADSRLTDNELRSLLPYPIAAAWHRVCTQSSSDSRRLELLRATLEITLRTLTGLLLPDYLRGEPTPAVEAAIKSLYGGPTDGKRVELVREVIRSLGRRVDPLPFMPDAYDWYFTRKGKPSEIFKLMDSAVSHRNVDIHGTARVSDLDTRQWADEFHGMVRQLLWSLRWLKGYRLFRIKGQVVPKRRTFAGKVQFFVGKDPETDPQPGEWTARLTGGETVYLVNPTGMGVLEVYPFLWLLHTSGKK